MAPINAVDCAVSGAPFEAFGGGVKMSFHEDTGQQVEVDSDVVLQCTD